MTLRDDLYLEIMKAGGVVRGTEYIALQLLGEPHHKQHVIDCLRQLEADGLITIIPSPQKGRGYKTEYTTHGGNRVRMPKPRDRRVSDER
jgi:hypothetical protein